jgi:peptidoglycan/xylan/chitin deacetylase (PgdA/CDA1 family)
MKALLRDLAASLCFHAGITPTRDARRFSIVTFHRVLPRDELDEYGLPKIAVTPEELAWFLEFFTRHFDCGTLERQYERWVAGEATPRPLLAVTFDDAQRDNFRHARAVLDRAGVRASFFVPTEALESGRLLWHDRAAYALHAWLRRDEREALRLTEPFGVKSAKGELVADFVERLKREPADVREAWIAAQEARLDGLVVPAWDGMMTFDELARLAAEEHEIGSHSHTHAILPQLDDAALRAELDTSARILTERLKRAPSSFCYPNGDADDRVVEALVASPYRRAVTTAWGDNRSGASRYRLRRFDMQGQTARSRRGELSSARIAFRMSPLQPGMR